MRKSAAAPLAVAFRTPTCQRNRMIKTQHTTLSRHHRVGLAVLGVAVVALYGAVGVSVFRAQDARGDPAGGTLSTALASSVPALRYDVIAPTTASLARRAARLA